MKDKYQVDCESDQNPEKEDVSYDSQAMKLLEEYGNKLISGEPADPKSYLDQYTGSDKEGFKIALNIKTVLTADAIKRKKKWNELEASGQIEEIQERIYRKLFENDASV